MTIKIPLFTREELISRIQRRAMQASFYASKLGEELSTMGDERRKASIANIMFELQEARAWATVLAEFDRIN